MKTRFPLIVCLTIFCSLLISSAGAQGTAFTYQGRLNDGTNPATGLYDFRFRLAADPLANTYVGAAFLTNSVPVNNGLFVTTMDLGANFTGNNVWLEVDVRTNGAGLYATLTPLQPLTPVPYAIFANTASNLLGRVSVAQLGIGATNANLPGTIVVRDASGNFAAGSVTVTNLVLPTASGTIYSSNISLLHYTGVYNFFAGPGAGTPSGGNGNNVGIGPLALSQTGNGSFQNTAVGSWALLSNTSGHDNTALGYLALMNGNGNYNSAFGSQSLANVTTAQYDTSVGWQSLNKNTSGGLNTAIGVNAAFSGTIAGSSTAVGYQALFSNVSGQNNIGIGYNAGYNVLGGNNIDIGSMGVRNDNGIIRIGTANIQTNTYIAGISGVSVPSGAIVVVSTNGQLGSASAGLTTNIPIGSVTFYITNGIIYRIQ